MVKFVKPPALVLGLALAACSQPFSAVPSGRLGAVPLRAPAARADATAKHGYAVLHAFAGGSGGDNPFAGMIVVKDAIFGTTLGEGSSKHFGTVFSFSGGTARTLAVFQGGREGDYPKTSLTQFQGKLFGTTIYGGDASCGSAPGCGTIFAIEAGAKHILYEFHGRAGDGDSPGRMLAVGTLLYGLTAGGGAHGAGTVFVYDPGTRRERLLYSFAGGKDGNEPLGGLIELHGALYGVTASGGPANAGTVFRVTTSGTESVLHAFRGGSDGGNPGFENLVPIADTLYGTTIDGGGGPCKNAYTGPGCGTVFSITPGGAERIVYRFRGGAEGWSVWSGVAALGGVLYGTTSLGGGTGCGGLGCGSVYAVTLKGRKSTLHAFAGGNDGELPYGTPVSFGGALYGTTTQGGSGNDGTIFTVAP